MAIDQGFALELIDRGMGKGASGAEVMVVEGESFSATVRLGATEKLSHARAKKLGLRLFCGQGSAASSTSDVTTDAIDRLLDETWTLARITARDEFAGLPPTCGQVEGDLQLWDGEAEALSVDEKIDLAREAEAHALGYDPRLTNSEGAGFSNSSTRLLLANSQGFVGEYRSSGVNLAVSPVASQEGRMQRDYWYTSTRRLRDMDPPAEVGRRAAQRALRRLGARKIPTQEAPVVFDPETAASLLRSLTAALSAYSIYKGASFLVDRLGQQVASPLVTIYDDGTIPAGLGSRPFDGEGVPTRRTPVIVAGRLQSFLLDTYSARKLGLASTGNAARGVGEVPGVGPTNFYLAPGAQAPQEIIGSVDAGLYVTELIGFGVNLVTGDYSRGAVGFWIEKGELAYPVEEITIASNLRQMLLAIEAVGNDLEFRSRVVSPTVKVGRMTIAGI